ncbi:RHS repeat-associated core domain-containing protein [Metasolibacillus meyeri]|uniref:RHS repeat-associated core domain-containing protein n=1 Tax=Metasolibacillus meyeri TaxID=1071052 RepID=A0AAW9NU68_9BACL|nr:RHS repeat-associated core domain-containing protein [Metasolibacillus meyeri]MEC1180006.1 RHS repeat-associated core domain-containing protein [Metasolibacillus meyeri]
MFNELTGIKTTYGYDEFSNLVSSSREHRFDFLYRSVDEVGNLYETQDKTDRVYGAGSRLLETREAKFAYDEEGNLIQKVESNGDTWHYAYFGNGMMSKVIRPDNTEVTFKYDALGRRIEKCSDEKTMRFVWEGNTILHEYFTQNDSDKFENLVKNFKQTDADIADNLVTWVFNDGFVPSAKITSAGHYSIISDYLGTPVEAYDEEGKKIWSVEFDIYGRVKEFTGEQDFIPFRYQGQYEDVEIGLYYNRFRYYDPGQGNYTQIDPIGLAGGNPTLYGYVSNPNIYIDIFGLNQGGSYTSVRATNIGGQVHHMPANSISPISHGKGPAIWMPTSKHLDTASWGSYSKAKQWRAYQKELIDSGKFGKAIEIDIRDVQRKFGSQFNDGIREMLEYAKDNGYITNAEQKRLTRKHCR